MNKRVLRFEPDLDFVLIAITSPLKDYRLCYFINKQLNFDLSRKPDLSIDARNDGQMGQFAVFQQYWEASETDLYLISNKGSEGLLIPEMRSVDYFVIIKNYIDDDELEELINHLNKIADIVAAVKIDPKKIKSRENLLF